MSGHSNTCLKTPSDPRGLSVNVTGLKVYEQCKQSDLTWFMVNKDASRTVSLELQKFIKPCVKTSWVPADKFMPVIEKLHKDFFRTFTDSQTDSIDYKKKRMKNKIQ